MKRLLLVLVMLAFNFANAQKIKTTDSFDIRITSKELKKTHKNKFVVTNELTLKDGSKIKIGDTFQLGESARKSSDTYASITMGRLTVGAALAGGVTYASATMIEADYILKDIKVTNYYGLVRATFFLKHSTSTSAISYITATDASLDNGELINPNAPLTREEAIAKLKEAKDLMDLGMMSQEEFETLRKELTPIIMNK